MPKQSTKNTPKHDEAWMRVVSQTHLDGEYTMDKRFFRVVKVSRFGRTSQHSGAVREATFVDDKGKEVKLKRNPIPNSTRLTKFQTPPKLRRLLGYDEWSSCTTCTLASRSEEPVYVHRLHGMS